MLNPASMVKDVQFFIFSSLIQIFQHVYMTLKKVNAFLMDVLYTVKNGDAVNTDRGLISSVYLMPGNICISFVRSVKV